jgi:hypothetical protein
VKVGLDTEPIRKKLNADQAKRKRDAQDEAAQALQSEINADNDNFVRDQRKQVQDTVKVQDQALGGLEQSLVNLHGRAKVINTELKEQDKLLDDLKGDVDNANDRILTVNKALGKLLDTKDGCQIWTVVILAVILIVLGKISVSHFGRFPLPHIISALLRSCLRHLDVKGGRVGHNMCERHSFKIVHPTGVRAVFMQP